MLPYNFILVSVFTSFAIVLSLSNPVSSADDNLVAIASPTVCIRQGRSRRRRSWWSRLNLRTDSRHAVPADALLVAVLANNNS